MLWDGCNTVQVSVGLRISDTNICAKEQKRGNWSPALHWPPKYGATDVRCCKSLGLATDMRKTGSIAEVITLSPKAILLEAVVAATLLGHAIRRPNSSASGLAAGRAECAAEVAENGSPMLWRGHRIPFLSRVRCFQ
jgi:hypothetical protein